MTCAVKEALRERYERLQTRRGKASVEELLAIAKRAWRPDQTSSSSSTTLTAA